MGIIFNTHKESWPRRLIFTQISLDLAFRVKRCLAHELHPKGSIIYHSSLLNETAASSAAVVCLVAGAPSDMPTYIGFSLPILQPLNCNTDVDGQMPHLSQGHFPNIAALEVDIEVHTHLPEFPLLLFFGKEGL